MWYLLLLRRCIYFLKLLVKLMSLVYLHCCCQTLHGGQKGLAAPMGLTAAFSYGDG